MSTTDTEASEPSAPSTTSSEEDPLTSSLLLPATTPHDFSRSLSSFLASFPGYPLSPHQFPIGDATVRGAIATRDIQAKEVVLKVPWAFVVSAQKACEEWHVDLNETSLTEHHLLAVWLMEQRAAGRDSKWWPYVCETLPKDFSSVPMTWSSDPNDVDPATDERIELLEGLPSCIVAGDLNETVKGTENDHPLCTLAEKRERMVASLQNDWKICSEFVEQHAKDILGFGPLLKTRESVLKSDPSSPDLDSAPSDASKKRKTRPGKPAARVSHTQELDWCSFIWAWLCVNTRIFSLTMPSHHELVTMALVPGADMLNHQPSQPAPSGRAYDITVTYHQTGAFSGAYVLTVNRDVAKGEQVFNWYGRVGSGMGWSEWGFVPFVEASEDEKPDRGFIEEWDSIDSELGGERILLLPLPGKKLDPRELKDARFWFVSSNGPHEKLRTKAEKEVLVERGEDTDVDPLAQSDEWVAEVDAEVTNLIARWCLDWKAVVEKALEMVRAKSVSLSRVISRF